MSGRAWVLDAGCVGKDPELWFRGTPGRGANLASDLNPRSSEAKAKAICAGCPVKEMCLREAMQTEESDSRWGIRGGLNPLERQRLAGGRPAPRVLPKPTKHFDDCGTYAACMRHRRRREAACEACLEAKRKYQRDQHHRRRAERLEQA